MTFDLDHFSLKIAALGSRLNIAWCRGGDQTLMVHKDLFGDLGGFDEHYNIAEDLLLCRKIYRHGNFEILPKSVITSGRKFLKNGVFKTQLRHIIVRIMIFSGFNSNVVNSCFKKWWVTFSYLNKLNRFINITYVPKNRFTSIVLREKN